MTIFYCESDMSDVCSSLEFQINLADVEIIQSKFNFKSREILYREVTIYFKSKNTLSVIINAEKFEELSQLFNKNRFERDLSKLLSIHEGYGLTVRATNILRGIGVIYWEDLCEFSKIDFLMQPQCGSVTIKEIQEGIDYVNKNFNKEIKFKDQRPGR